MLAIGKDQKDSPIDIEKSISNYREGLLTFDEMMWQIDVVSSAYRQTRVQQIIEAIEMCNCHEEIRSWLAK